MYPCRVFDVHHFRALVDHAVGRHEILVEHLADGGPAGFFALSSTLLHYGGEYGEALFLDDLDVSEEQVTLLLEYASCELRCWLM